MSIYKIQKSELMSTTLKMPILTKPFHALAWLGGRLIKTYTEIKTCLTVENLGAKCLKHSRLPSNLFK
jgi:hypothetical protein